jgi:hopanoid biosynthesis associated protein HpnK
MRRFLIVTADDFGLHPAVNEAVERASRAGILTAASLMVGAPAAADAVRRARALPALRTGLHLMLADGQAVLSPREIPALVDQHGSMDSRMFLNGVRFFALPSVRRQLEAEIRAQFESYRNTGLDLDHVNVHKHFHMHPTLLAMILRIGREFGAVAVRVPDEPLWFSARGPSGVIGAAGALALRPWLKLMKHRLKSEGVAHNDRIFGIAASGSMDEKVLLEILERLPAGVTEIYLHPATESGAAIAQSMREYRHCDELAALLSPRVRAALDKAAVACGGYRDLTNSRR